MVLALQLWLLVGGVGALILRAKNELNLTRLLISLVLGPILLVWSVYAGVKMAVAKEREKNERS
jgi:hypothetical protein